MANEDTAVVDAPVTAEGSSGVADDGNMTVDQIAGMWAQATEPAEPEGVSEEGEGEVAEQVTDTEPETDEDSIADEGDSDEEADEDAEDSDDDVLSKLSPSAAKKARKRIDKLTARAKDAEEALQARDREMSELKSRLESLERSGKQDTSDSQELSFADRVNRAESANDLKQLRDIAWQTKEFCRENWDESHVELGKDENGDPRIINHKELAQMLNEAERVLEQDIPKRQEYIKQREIVAKNALRDFPAWKDKNDPDHKRLLQLWNDPVASEFLHRMPNGTYITGVILEGIKAMEARAKGDAKAADETPAKESKPAPKKEQKIAPKVPGVDGGAGPTESSSSDFEKRFHSSTSLSNDDLVAYFAAQERAKAKR